MSSDLGSLTEYSVRGNGLDVQSARAPAKVATQKLVMLFGIKHNQDEASFQDQDLKPPDAILIANDICVSRSLTQVLAFCPTICVRHSYLTSVLLCCAD